MKEPEFIEIELEQPMTALELALQAHAEANLDLAEHKESMKALRTRIGELQSAISELQSKASKSPGMARLSLEQIKSLSAEKRADYEYLASLQSALDIGVIELRDLESDERGLWLVLEDTRTHSWLTLYRQLLAAMDLNGVRQLATASLLGGMDRRQFVEELLGWDEGLDAGVASGLSEQFGLPL